MIDRAGRGDLAMLALDRPGGVPQHVGALLLLGAAPRAAEELRGALVARAAGVPRLRQRLVGTPLGCGPPVWADDPAADPARHVRVLPCAEPGDERALLDLAAAVLVEPLPRDRPLWAAVVVPGRAGDALAVVVVLHHALADGLGGLEVLSRLVDGVAPGPARPFPQPVPGWRELGADAARARVRALTRPRAAWREARRSLAAAGGLRPVRAAPCSLLGPTGPRRCFATARADLAALHRTAHAHGASVNDVLLAALAGAVCALLAGRGERVAALRVAVVVAAHREGPGNRVAPLLVTVPTDGTAAQRLRRVAGVVGAKRDAADAPPPIALPLVRRVARGGPYRRYMAHQHRLHLLVSNVPGPPQPVALAGLPVTGVVPLGVGEAGNLTTTVLALSYAGTLTVTLVVDPDRVTDLDRLVRAVQDELAGYARAPG